MVLKQESKLAKPKPPKARKKLGFNEQKELKALPRKIEKLENTISELQQTLSDPAFYQREEKGVSDTQSQLNKKESELELLYERWEELESDGK